MSTPQDSATPRDPVYVVNLSHHRRDSAYITVWRPDNKGYAWPLAWAGRYDREAVLAHPDYYNNGCSNVAVPCWVLDSVAGAPAPHTVDGDAGPVVLSTKENWKRILQNLIAVPAHEPRPLYKGARYPRKTVAAQASVAA